MDGMRENIQAGFRAGGRAPMGYVLKRFPLGIIRDGKPVTKTKLERGPTAEMMQTYLRRRAAGEPRTALMRELKITCNPSSMIGVEWNALVYAGHTVWNQHDGSTHRPREEGHINRNTHDALITDEEAERLITQLTISEIGRARARGKQAASKYLLSGYLVDPETGLEWRASSGYYRLPAHNGRSGKSVKCEELDAAVLAQLNASATDDAFLGRLLEASREIIQTTDPTAPLLGRLKNLRKERDRGAQLALTTDTPDVYTRLVAERSQQIVAIEREVEALASEQAARKAVTELTVPRMKAMLEGISDDPGRAQRPW